MNIIDSRGQVIEEKPAQNLDKVISIMITGIVTVVLGFF